MTDGTGNTSPMTDTQASADELLVKLASGPSTSKDVGTHLRKYQALCEDAADEITRLRKRVEELEGAFKEERREACSLVGFMCGAFEQVQHEAPWFEKAFAQAKAFLRARTALGGSQ